jgi:hypothetical protein
MYERMASVLEFTARQQCPGWEIDVRPMGDWRSEVKHYQGAQDNWIYNTQKLNEWTGVLLGAEEGRLVVFLDADMMVTAPLDPAREIPFDFAYTTKIPGKTRLPFNGGCVMARATDAARGFMTSWRDTNERLINNRPEHMRYRQKYAGMNQAALGATLESKATAGVQIHKLPVLEWNCEDSSWEDFGPGTRVLHFKGRLRAAVFNSAPGARRPHLMKLAELWHNAEAAAREEAAA